MSHHGNEFDAAKAIVANLKDLDKAQQERVLRWVAESIGVHGLPLRSAPVTGSVSPTLPTASGSAEGVPAGVPAGTMDIRTFIRSRGPKSDNQLATAVAYYFKFVAPPREKKDAIDGADLADAIRLISGWKQPKRPQKTLFNAKNQGYLDSAGTGKFRINSVGENLVTMTLGGDGANAVDTRKATKPRRQPRKRAKTAKKK